MCGSHEDSDTIFGPVRHLGLDMAELDGWRQFCFCLWWNQFYNHKVCFTLQLVRFL